MIDTSKPRTQYRINVSRGPGHPEWSTKRHLFMTRWQDMTEAEAKEWHGLIKKHFPEKHHWEITVQVRTKYPRSTVQDAPWMPWMQFLLAKGKKSTTQRLKTAGLARPDEQGSI